MWRHVAAGGRFEWPAEVLPYGYELVALAEECWHQVPEKRPTAQQLQGRLLDILMRLSAPARA
jgi:hypothetical protein